MADFHVYRDMEARTKGEIYLGVVGPVRTGKSTFIKRFMELLVLPFMEDENSRNLSRDELPQSAAGKTVMTTEPKFIPKDAAQVQLGDGISVKVRLIDCVGFMVDGAAGHIENDAERMVKTPWSETEIPFTKAAEIGTRKVITDHSTIGVVVTCDGSFGDLKRPNYIAAEQTAIDELKALHKPFIVLLNSVRPYSDETTALAEAMEEEYGVTVMPVNCEQLKKEDVYHILEKVLMEFPVVRLDFSIPKWLEILPSTHPVKAQVVEAAKQVLSRVDQMKDAAGCGEGIQTDHMREMRLDQLDMASGRLSMNVVMGDDCYYQILSDFTGLPIEGEYQLMQTLENLSKMQREYEKVQDAVSQVRLKGYGAVTPDRSEILLDEPQVIRHGNKYGVKIKAEAPSIHMIKAQIQTEIAPIVGSEQQAQDLITYIKECAREDQDGIWDANIFGKSIEQIVGDGIHAKISQLTDESQLKLQDTMQKIINDSNGGMICIII